MRRTSFGSSGPVLALLLLAGAPRVAPAQLVRLPLGPAPAAPAPPSIRQMAESAPGRRLIVSVRERKLWYRDGARTLYTAPVAVGKGTRLSYGGSAWRFVTPRGARRVIAKERDPVWIPPLWHYVELARDSSFVLVHLKRGAATPLADGSRLEVRGTRVVHLLATGEAEDLPADEEVIFGDTLFVPPVGTENRRIPGELGAYRLDLGDGYMLHGTPEKASIGQAVTHGCIRLGDRDLEYLFRNVPVGTPVYIY